MPNALPCLIIGAGATEYQPPDVNNPCVFVILTDIAGAFQNAWFYVTGPMQNQILAAALCAISTGNQVIAVVDPLDDGGGNGHGTQRPHTPQCYEIDVVTQPLSRPF
jgi:hypothetical protein